MINDLAAVATDVLMQNVCLSEALMTIELCVAHRLSRVSAPSEGMLQLRQGAPAVQPDPRLRVRDGGLSPGVLLPGGGQETGGTNRRPAPPSPCLPLRAFRPSPTTPLASRRVVKFAPRSGF